MNKDLQCLKGKICIYLDYLIQTSTNKQGKYKYGFAKSLNEYLKRRKVLAIGVSYLNNFEYQDIESKVHHEHMLNFFFGSE